MEAGSGRGSIKKARPAYAELIAAINAATKQRVEAKVAADPVFALRREIEELTRRLDQSLDREVALLSELYDLRAENKQLKSTLQQQNATGLLPVR